MTIFNYKIKYPIVAAIGLVIILVSIFYLSEYGKLPRLIIVLIGAGIVSLSTGNKKYIAEAKALVIIVIIALSVKVTVLEAYIVPTGSMEKTIMTGDFLIGSRFVYGMRTPNWIGIPYTDTGMYIPSIKFPKFS